MVRSLIRRPALFRLLLLFTWIFYACAFAQPANDKPLVLALGPRSAAFFTAYNSMYQDLETEFRLEFRETAEAGSYDAFERSLESLKPQVIVLLDNHAIGHYHTYQRKHADRESFPPAIAAMSLFVSESVKGLKNVAAVGYQMPVNISISPLRLLLKRPIKKVGVIYRKQQRPFFQRQAELLRDIEQIELVGREIESMRNLNRNLRRELNYLIKKEDIDVLWVPNDSALLLAEGAMIDVWLPKLRAFKKPIVVNVPTLMNEPYDIGTFAVLPDHQELGLQLAQKIVRIRDSDWQIQEPFEEAYSRYTIFNKGFATRFLQLNQDKIDEIVDKIIE